jgi:hypothetical protein
MDDNFTTGPKDYDNQLSAVKAAMDDVTAFMKEFRGRLDDRLRAMQLDVREMSVSLAAMNRIIERRQPIDPALSADKRALLNLRRDYIDLAEMYTSVQKRMDQRLDEVERKLEPPLPPFPEFKP